MVFPCSNEIARCFRIMKDKGFLPTLFVTRAGKVRDDEYRALHTPVTGPQMGTMIDFLSCGGDGEQLNMKEWNWELTEEEGMTEEERRDEDQEGEVEEEMPKVVREAPR